MTCPMATCQCTCGKHTVLDTSNSVTIPVQGATGAAGAAYPVTVFHHTNAAEMPQMIDVVPNTAGAGPTMPNCASVRIEP